MRSISLSACVESLRMAAFCCVPSVVISQYVLCTMDHARVYMSELLRGCRCPCDCWVGVLLRLGVLVHSIHICNALVLQEYQAGYGV